MDGHQETQPTCRVGIASRNAVVLSLRELQAMPTFLILSSYCIASCIKPPEWNSGAIALRQPTCRVGIASRNRLVLSLRESQAMPTLYRVIMVRYASLTHPTDRGDYV